MIKMKCHSVWYIHVYIYNILCCVLCVGEGRGGEGRGGCESVMSGCVGSEGVS